MAASFFKRRRAAKWRRLVEAFVDRQFRRVLEMEIPSPLGREGAALEPHAEDEEDARITAQNKERAVAFFLSSFQTQVNSFGSVSPSQVEGDLECLERQLETQQQPFKAAALREARRKLFFESDLPLDPLHRERLCNALCLLLLLSRGAGARPDADFAEQQTPRPSKPGAFASSKNNADAAALEDFASLLSEQRDAFDRELRWATRGEEAVSSSSSDLGEGEDEEDVAAKDFADEKRGSDFQLEVSLHHGALPRETRLFTLLEKQRAQLLERQRRRFERLGLTDALPSKPFCAQLCTWPPEEAALAAECKVVGELKKILGEKGDSLHVAGARCLGPRAEEKPKAMGVSSLRLLPALSLGDGRLHLVSEAWVLERVLAVLGGLDASPLFERVAAVELQRGESDRVFSESCSFVRGVPLAVRLSVAFASTAVVPHLSPSSLQETLSAFLPTASAVLLFQRLRATTTLGFSTFSTTELSTAQRTASLRAAIGRDGRRENPSADTRAALACAAASSVAARFEEERQKNFPSSLSELSRVCRATNAEARRRRRGSRVAAVAAQSFSGGSPLGRSLEAFLFAVGLIDRQWQAQLQLLRLRQLRALENEWGFCGNSSPNRPFAYPPETERAAASGPLPSLFFLRQEEHLEEAEVQRAGEGALAALRRRRPVSLLWIQAQLAESMRLWEGLAALTEQVLVAANNAATASSATSGLLLSSLLLRLRRCEAAGDSKGQRLWRFLLRHAASPLLLHLDNLLASGGHFSDPLGEFRVSVEASRESEQGGGCFWPSAFSRCLASAEEAGRALSAASAAALVVGFAGSQGARFSERERGRTQDEDDEAPPPFEEEALLQDAPLTAALKKDAEALLVSRRGPSEIDARNAPFFPPLDWEAEVRDLAEAERDTAAACKAVEEDAALGEPLLGVRKVPLRAPCLRLLERHFADWKTLPERRQSQTKTQTQTVPSSSSAKRFDFLKDAEQELGGAFRAEGSFESFKKSGDVSAEESDCSTAGADSSSSEESLCFSTVFIEQQVALSLERQRRLGAELVFLKSIGDGCALEFVGCLRGFFSFLADASLLPVVRQFFRRADAPLAHSDPLLLERLLQEAFFPPAKDAPWQRPRPETNQEARCSLDARLRPRGFAASIQSLLLEARLEPFFNRGPEGSSGDSQRGEGFVGGTAGVSEVSVLDAKVCRERGSLERRLFSLQRVKGALRCLSLSLEGRPSLLLATSTSSSALAFASLQVRNASLAQPASSSLAKFCATRSALLRGLSSQIRPRGISEFSRAALHPAALDAASALLAHGLELRRALVVCTSLEKAAEPFAALFHSRRRTRLALQRAAPEEALSERRKAASRASAGETAVCALHRVLSGARRELLLCLSQLQTHRGLVLESSQAPLLRVLGRCRSVDALSATHFLHLLFLVFATLVPLSPEAAAAAEGQAAAASHLCAASLEASVLKDARLARVLPAARLVFALNAAAAPHLLTLLRAPLELLQILRQAARVAQTPLPPLTMPGDDEPLFVDLCVQREQQPHHAQEEAEAACCNDPQTPRTFRQRQVGGAEKKWKNPEAAERFREALRNLTPESLETIRSLTRSAEAVFFNARRATAALVSLTSTGASSLPSEERPEAEAAAAAARECFGVVCKSGEELMQQKEFSLELSFSLQAAELLAALHSALDGSGFYSSRLREAYDLQRQRAP